MVQALSLLTRLQDRGGQTMDPAILVVESEGASASILSLLEDILKLQMHVARDALHAITLVQRHSYLALVISGGLGYIDGWALLRYVESNLQNLHTIVVAPSPESKIEFAREFLGRVECLQAGDLRDAVERRIRGSA